MGNFPVIRPKELIKFLQRKGFIIVRTKGSHVLMRLNQTFVTIPQHNKPLKRGTLLAILRQIGLKKDDLKL